MKPFAEVERDYLKELAAQCGGNTYKGARISGINRPALARKFSKLNMLRERLRANYKERIEWLIQ